MIQFARFASLLRQVAMFALVAMMAVTIIDVSMRLLLNELVLGSVEIVQLALVCCVFLALPETFARDEQITVDAVDQLSTPATVRWLRRIAAILTVLLLFVMAARTVPPAMDTIEVGDRSSDLLIPFFWYWLPIVIGVSASAVAALVVAVRIWRLRLGEEG
jgi:TRAP-type C4-dicarboxylate transport system permease small subunit